MIKLIEYSPEPNYYKGFILEIWLNNDIVINYDDPILVSYIINENCDILEKRNFINTPENAADFDKINWKLSHARNYFINNKCAKKYGFYLLHKIWTNKEALIDLFTKRNEFKNEIWRAESWAKLNN